MLDASLAKSTEPEKYDVPVRLLGTGANPPTIVIGKGVTISRTGVGDYKLTFADNPGPYCGFASGIEATTRSAMYGVTVVGKFTAATATARATFELTVASGGTTPAVRELAAAEWVNLTINFKRVNV